MAGPRRASRRSSGGVGSPRRGGAVRQGSKKGRLQGGFVQWVRSSFSFSRLRKMFDGKKGVEGKGLDARTVRDMRSSPKTVNEMDPVELRAGLDARIAVQDQKFREIKKDENQKTFECFLEANREIVNSSEAYTDAFLELREDAEVVKALDEGSIELDEVMLVKKYQELTGAKGIMTSSYKANLDKLTKPQELGEGKKPLFEDGVEEVVDNSIVEEEGSKRRDLTPDTELAAKVDAAIAKRDIDLTSKARIENFNLRQAERARDDFAKSPHGQMEASLAEMRYQLSASKLMDEGKRADLLAQLDDAVRVFKKTEGYQGNKENAVLLLNALYGHLELELGAEYFGALKVASRDIKTARANEAILNKFLLENADYEAILSDSKILNRFDAEAVLRGMLVAHLEQGWVGELNADVLNGMLGDVRKALKAEGKELNEVEVEAAGAQGVSGPVTENTESVQGKVSEHFAFLRDKLVGSSFLREDKRADLMAKLIDLEKGFKFSQSNENLLYEAMYDYLEENMSAEYFGFLRQVGQNAEVVQANEALFSKFVNEDKGLLVIHASDAEGRFDAEQMMRDEFLVPLELGWGTSLSVDVLENARNVLADKLGVEAY